VFNVYTPETMVGDTGEELISTYEQLDLKGKKYKKYASTINDYKANLYLIENLPLEEYAWLPTANNYTYLIQRGNEVFEIGYMEKTPLIEEILLSFKLPN
jgi:hypothetical protein